MNPENWQRYGGGDSGSVRIILVQGSSQDFLQEGTRDNLSEYTSVSMYRCIESIFKDI